MRPVCRQSRVLPLVLGLCSVDSVKPDEVGYCIGILLVATDPFFEIKGSQQLYISSKASDSKGQTPLNSWQKQLKI